MRKRAEDHPEASLAPYPAEALGKERNSMRLTSSRAKFERARLHRESLLNTGKAWLDDNWGNAPLSIDKRTEPWRDGGELVTYSVGADPHEVPVEIALILGDALFDYRAALDHLAWHLVIAAGAPKRPQDVYFPVVSVRSRFTEEFRKKMPGVSDIVKSIIQRWQPFQNGPQWDMHPLAILNAWNVDDKHRAVPVVATNAMTINIEAPGSYANFEVWNRERTEHPGYLTPGTDLLRIYGKRTNPLREAGVLVKFWGGAGLAYEGKSLEAHLSIIDSAVDDVLSEFERLP